MDEAPGKKRWWLLAVAGILLLMIAIAISVHWANESVWTERQRVADQVLAGALKPDAAGIVALPAECRGMTADGNLYVTQLPGGGVQILFVTWRGKGANLQGYLFTSRRVFYDIDSGPTASIVAPSVPPAGLSAVVDVSVESELRPGWYRVSYRMN